MSVVMEKKSTKAKLRVLAVDDNSDILELIRATLGDDYDVLTLIDPVDIYQVMDVFEPDLLILDIMMPRITGYQLIEIIRKNPMTQNIPIIVLSAKNQPNEIKHGYRLGATMYIPKPFEPQRLYKNVQTQFTVQPPSQRPKCLTDEKLVRALENLQAFKKGNAELTGMELIKKSGMKSLRERMRERILKKQRGEV